MKASDLIDIEIRRTGYSEAYVHRLYVMEGLVRRIFALPNAEDWIIRGSLATRQWIAEFPRVAKDIDLMGRFPYDCDRAFGMLEKALQETDWPDGLQYEMRPLLAETTWANTDLPGLRMPFAVEFAGEVHELSVDIAFNDPLVPLPVWMPYRPVGEGGEFRMHTVLPELAAAWKAHGLFEFWDRGGIWRIKDLYDFLVMCHFHDMDQSLFQEALYVAFTDRKTPFSVYERILSGNFGLSRGSRKNWRNFSKKLLHQPIAESVPELVAKARKILDPYFTVWIAEEAAKKNLS